MSITLCCQALEPVTRKATNWPSPGCEAEAAPQGRSTAFAQMRHRYYRNVYARLISRLQSDKQVFSPYRDRQQFCTVLSLFNPGENILIPLFANGPDTVEFGRQQGSTIPLSAPCINELFTEFSDIKKADHWFYALTDHEDHVLRLLAPATTSINDLPGYVRAKGDRPPSVDLNSPALAVKGRFHGLARLTTGGSPTVAIVLTGEASGPDRRIAIDRKKLDFLRHVPDAMKADLALVSAIDRIGQRQTAERVITPLTALTLADEFIDSAGCINIATRWNALQLSVAKAQMAVPPLSFMATRLSVYPEVVTASRPLFDLVLGHPQQHSFHHVTAACRCRSLCPNVI